MRHHAKFSLLLIVGLAAIVYAAPKKEYFTEDELDLIRDAQELNMRVPTYLKLAERRLIFLGIMEKSQQQIEKERKEKEKRAKEQKKGSSDSRANADKAPIDDTSYLEDFSPPELLRGYIQALDEVMSNIDDAYSRKLDVRDSIEDLAKFTRDTIPLLEKFKPKNQGERAALQDAVDKANEASNQAKDALKVVPKTEKKRTQ
jgi:Xaa-Pro aminopeptidase